METNNVNKTIVYFPKPRILKIFLVIGFLFIVGCYYLLSPLKNKDMVIHISSSQTADSIYSEIENKKIVRNDKVLKLFVRLMSPNGGVISGDYLIKRGTPVWIVAWQIGRGHHNTEPVKITMREGLTNEEMAIILSNKLINFEKESFLNKTKDKQGYLFPDTYFFYPLDTEDEVIGKMSDNFQKRTKSILPTIESTNKSLSEIIIMASVLEGEAGGAEDIAIISGILWKRISLGMRLQVDIDKNTYINSGLPQKPLNNPGLMSIKAAVNPINSSYLYYLHDKNGKVHYAKTFEEHKLNIKRYLK